MKLTIVEVGPRDGLQNEQIVVPTSDKIEFVNRLSAAGLPVIEVSAFVHPKWVPQLADAEQVFAGITRREGTRYTALVPNLAGLDRAMRAGVHEIAIFAASSEAFSRKNINQSIDESFATNKQVCEQRSRRACGCGGISRRRSAVRSKVTSRPRHVAELAARLAELGVFEVAVSDTIGIAHPPVR